MINTINSGGQVVTPWGVGDWDRAIILTLTLTGRRRAEVLNLKAGDLTQYGDAVLYGYRGKGGKQGKRELPQPAVQAIQVALAAFGKDLANMKPGESLWPSSASSRPAHGRGISSGTFYGNLRRYFRSAGLPPAGVHISATRRPSPSPAPTPTPTPVPTPTTSPTPIHVEQCLHSVDHEQAHALHLIVTESLEPHDLHGVIPGFRVVSDEEPHEGHLHSVSTDSQHELHAMVVPCP